MPFQKQKPTKANSSKGFRLLIGRDASKSAHKNRHFLGAKTVKSGFSEGQGANFVSSLVDTRSVNCCYCLEKLINHGSKSFLGRGLGIGSSLLTGF